MQENAKGVIDFENFLSSLPTTWIKIIIQPVDFYKQMPRSGGFAEPLLFLVCMSVVGSVLNTILSIFGLGFYGFFLALASIIIYPIFMGIFSFVGALILFFIWKIMGSNESFESAYRCGAYASAITPIAIILYIIPYLGVVLALLWSAFLIVEASVEVNNIERKTAWIVFGIIFAVFALISIGVQCGSRKVSSEAEKIIKDKMSPEDAEKVQNLIRSLKKQIEEEKE